MNEANERRAFYSSLICLLCLRYAEMVRHLTEDKEAIKVFIEVALEGKDRNGE